MRNIFKFKPKIKKGHSFDEYISKYSNDYVNCKLEEVNDSKKLKPNKTYWEIGNKFYQVNHKSLFVKLGLIIGSLGVVTSIVLPITYHFINKERYVDYKFQYMNDCESLRNLKNYVKEVTTPSNNHYIPKIDRIATFDMDGTLYGERSEIYIEWMYFNDYLNRHQDKKDQKITISEAIVGESGKTPHEVSLEQVSINISKFMKDRVSPETSEEGGKTYKIDLEMREAYAGAILFAGLTIDEYINDFNTFLEKDTHSFNNLKFKDMFYKPMIEVVEFLKVNNFDVYIVSGTDRFMVRDIVNQHIVIPSNKVIGMDVSLEWDAQRKVVTRGSELKYKNVKNVKVELITQEICKKPVLSFGNSSGDVQMHDYALSNDKYKCGAYMVLADDNDREFGYDDATIASRKAMWKGYGYNIFSMKDDFKTIYGDNVTKKLS